MGIFGRKKKYRVVGAAPWKKLEEHMKALTVEGAEVVFVESPFRSSRYREDTRSFWKRKREKLCDFAKMENNSFNGCIFYVEHDCAFDGVEVDQYGVHNQIFYKYRMDSHEFLNKVARGAGSDSGFEQMFKAYVSQRPGWRGSFSHYCKSLHHLAQDMSDKVLKTSVACIVEFHDVYDECRYFVFNFSASGLSFFDPLIGEVIIGVDPDDFVEAVKAIAWNYLSPAYLINPYSGLPVGRILKVVERKKPAASS